MKHLPIEHRLSSFTLQAQARILARLHRQAVRRGNMLEAQQTQRGRATVRRALRAFHLAACYARGTRYRDVERWAYRPVVIDDVLDALATILPDVSRGDLSQSVLGWLSEPQAATTPWLAVPANARY